MKVNESVKFHSEDLSALNLLISVSCVYNETQENAFKHCNTYTLTYFDLHENEKQQ